MQVYEWLSLPDVLAMTKDSEMESSALYGDYLARGGTEGNKAFSNVLVGSGFVRRKSNGRIYYCRPGAEYRTKATRPIALSVSDRETFTSLGNGDLAHGLRLAAAMVRAGVLANMSPND